jgi:hypothetical protein
MRSGNNGTGVHRSYPPGPDPSTVCMRRGSRCASARSMLRLSALGFTPRRNPQVPPRSSRRIRADRPLCRVIEIGAGVCRRCRAAAMLIGCLLLGAGSGTAVGADADWPLFRHDLRLTGATPAKGAIRKPKILWSRYLGAPLQELVSRKGTEEDAYDLAGDGNRELFQIQGRTLHIQTQALSRSSGRAAPPVLESHGYGRGAGLLLRLRRRR